MSKKTEAANIDIKTLVPQIASLVKTAIRLHPTPNNQLPANVSKIGGRFLWPMSEPWPLCQDTRHEYATKKPILVPVVQLCAADFPEIEFRSGSDIFQLLWCPVTEDSCDDLRAPKPFSYWRNSTEIDSTLDFDPPTDTSEIIEDILLFQKCIPNLCALSPERVHEYPVVGKLPKKIRDFLQENNLWYDYQDEEGPCPSAKVGGHPCWHQGDDTPKCKCGNKMDFLLQLSDWEYTNMDTCQRWIPLEDRWAVKKINFNPYQQDVLDILKPMRFDFNHYTKYVFVCRSCDEWPVKLVEQN